MIAFSYIYRLSEYLLADICISFGKNNYILDSYDIGGIMMFVGWIDISDKLSPNENGQTLTYRTYHTGGRRNVKKL